jgi:hypothetical protein
MVESTSLKAVW